MEQQPPVGQGLPIVEDSRLHSDTSQSVGLLWSSDQPVAEVSTLQHTTFARDKHLWPPTGFEPAIPASERPQTLKRPRPGDRLDRPLHKV